MKLRGRRIHIVGSADPESDEEKLSYVHSLMSELAESLASEGATFVIPFGTEPFLQERSEGPSIIFDWTVAEAAYRALKDGRAESAGPNGRLIATLATNKTESQIPARLRPIYDDLRDSDAVSMEFLDPGWSAGAVRRARLAQLGDILIAVSGGQGVEQVAIEYSSMGKPVVPLDIQIGASQRDGSGGASRLFDRALARPNDFFRVSASDSPAELLERTRTHNGETPAREVIAAMMSLLHALTPPRVFYVRLLNETIPEYTSVESFFRTTVDNLVKELGYKPLQMGIGKNEFAWMNQAIFDSLHHSSVVLVDLTALRPNCFMELGYALGNKQRAIVTARDDTRISFDAFALEAFQWNESEDPAKRIDRFRSHWEKEHQYADARPPKGGQMKPERYFSVDIESAGPIPGKYSMLSLGASVVGNPEATFYVELKPISREFVPDALKVSGFDLDRLEQDGEAPTEAMKAFRGWVETVSADYKPVFLGFNACFDWQFVNWYLESFAGGNPFGFAGIDIKSYFMGLSGCHWSETTSSQLPAEFQPDTPQTHNALDDARAQASIFEKLLAKARSKDR